MNSRLLFCVAFVAGSLITVAGSRAADWPQFRGPGGNATSYDTQTPVSWDDSKNVAWKTPLPGRGASSAIVFGERIFLTAYTGYGVGEEPGDKADLKLHVLCLKRSTGEILWDESIDPSEATQNFGKRVADHGYATGTPATDGQHVYAYFGVSGLVAFDMDGKLKWRKETGTETAGFGSASSPVIHEDVVYVNASIESGTLFAFNKVTGEEVWKVSPINRAWTTPCIAETADGKHELIINHKDEINGLDPKTGEKLWWCEGIQDYIVPVPVFHDGIAYCLGGRSNRSIAVKLGGRGDVTETHKLWESTIGANVTSPIYYEGRLYWASDKAIEVCLDAKTGEEVYRERLPTRARVYGSIVRAGDKLYVTTRDLGILVLATGPEFKVLAQNQFKEDTSLLNASPAVSGNQLLVRTDRFLYCIGSGK
jgi:outer membrane protein assembly factor BamB